MIKQFEKFRVVCPVCGNTLFKSNCSEVEMECNRCKSLFQIKVTEEQIVYTILYANSKNRKACMA